MNFIYKQIRIFTFCRSMRFIKGLCRKAVVSIFVLLFFFSSIGLAREPEISVPIPESPDQLPKIPTIGFSREQEVGPDVDGTPRINLDIKGMDVVDALKILADKGGFNLSIGGNVRGRVTLFLKDINVWDALDIVIISGNLAYEKRGDIIYIMTERDYELRYGKSYWDKRSLEVFNLKYAKATKAGSILSQVASKIGKVITDEPTSTIIVMDIPEKVTQMRDILKGIDKPIETKIFALNYLPVDKLEPKVTEMLNKDVGTVKIDEATNKIIIADYPEKLKDIEEVIRAFDEKPLQVLIDAKIVEIKPSRKFYTGINWHYWIEKFFQVKGTFTMPSATGVSDNVQFGTIGITDVFNEGDYTGVLEFLEIFGDTKILSSPRILALNNEEAKIVVGTRDVYITSAVSEVGDSLTTTQTVNFVDVGVKLYVTPTINRAGYVTLKIKPEISSAEREDITSEDKITEVPVVTTSEAETTVIVKDGISVIIGGLRKISRQKERRQVPVLGSIPLIGGLFRSKKDEWEKNELVILLTPHIISGEKSIEAELHDKRREVMWEEDVRRQFERERREEYWEDTPEDEIEDWIESEKIESRTTPEERNIYAKSQPHQIQEEDREAVAVEEAFEEEEFVATPEVAVVQETKENWEHSYYSKITEKITSTTTSFLAEYRDVLSQGGEEVKLRFVLSRQGRLLREPMIISSSQNYELENVAKALIRRASPFPSFPEWIEEEQKAFEILLIF
ncbi:MAG: TonB C-terminal domain-containing protein [Candidatus Omnitrophota bacterium]|nr:MAG: TonB C-terminal domain-containing protein [Candidatus Omnitrophota bacterium]